MEDNCCSRQDAKHAKKPMDMTPLFSPNRQARQEINRHNIPLPWRTWRLGESPKKIQHASRNHHICLRYHFPQPVPQCRLGGLVPVDDADLTRLLAHASDEIQEIFPIGMG